MADRTITIKKYDGSNWDNFYPKTTIAQVINLSTQLANMQSDISGKAPLNHSHTKSEIVDFSHSHVKSEIVDFAHNHSASDITVGEFSPDRIPSIPASKIGTGIINTGRLGSGTANASKILYGDGTWKDAPTVGEMASWTLLGTFTDNTSPSFDFTGYVEVMIVNNGTSGYYYSGTVIGPTGSNARGGIVIFTVSGTTVTTYRVDSFVIAASSIIVGKAGNTSNNISFKVFAR